MHAINIVKIEGEIDNSVIIVDDFNILLAAIGRISTQKISKDVGDLNNPQLS